MRKDNLMSQHPQLLENIILPSIEEPTKLITFEFDAETQQYYVRNFDANLYLVEQWIEEAQEYEYREEDRKLLRAMNAQLNKNKAEIKRQLKEQTQHVLSRATEESELLIAKLANLRSILQQGLDEDDMRLKEEKRQLLEERYDEIVTTFDNLVGVDELTFNEIYNASWLNRTSKLNKSYEELHKRLKTLSSVLEQPTLLNKKMTDVIDALHDEGWDGLAAISLLNKNEHERQAKLLQEELAQRAREELAAKLAQEQELAQEEPKVIPDVLIRITGEDWERAKQLLDASRIEYRQL